ncbi:hypothetical protein M8J76_013889 [Diaphorina citri]|nr:hypothetical protein M8J76_013889 [Diaphorina citri]
MANSLFIAHIPSNITARDLREMFKRDNFTISRMESLETPDRIRVVCVDQCVADKIIDKYNGRVFHGVRLVVEPWMEFNSVTSRKKCLSASNNDPDPFERPTKPFSFTESSCAREFVPLKNKANPDKCEFE